LTIYSSTGVFDGTGLTIEQNAYYPFGARHSYGSRWLTQDPLAQKYYPHSPYSFSGNNPVLYVDSDGRA
jgi:hypothetical protein